MNSVRIAVLAISDTRTLNDDISGALLAERIESAGHMLAERKIARDDIGDIQAVLKAWIDKPDIDVIITTGGTGLTGRDVTPEAVKPLFDKEIEGFATVFHMVSYESVGVSTLQSRATAGIAGGTFIFVLPGSKGAVCDGWDKVIIHELDVSYKPCNLITIMPRLQER